MICNQSRTGFELVLPCPFPTTINITPRAPLSAYVTADKLPTWVLNPRGKRILSFTNSFVVSYLFRTLLTVVNSTIFIGFIIFDSFWILYCVLMIDTCIHTCLYTCSTLLSNTVCQCQTIRLKIICYYMNDVPLFFRICRQCLVWFGLLGFMAYQPLQVIKRQIHFYVNNQSHFKQFSLAWFICLMAYQPFFRLFNAKAILLEEQ